MNRRNFLKTIGALGIGSMFAPRIFAIEPAAPGGVVRAGLISDLHHLSFKKDEIARLTAFMDAVEKEKPDFLLECGDFTYPDGVPAILEQWNRFAGPKYHVLGNHDMDKCDKATYLKLMGAEKAYYSVDHGSFHFVMLDRNHFKDAGGKIISYAKANWAKAKGESLSRIDSDQLNWLRDDLKKTQKPSILFMHQPIAVSNSGGFDGNAAEIVALIDEINDASRKDTGKLRVIAAFFGHDHNDLYVQKRDVHYIMINSSSYAYRGAPWYYKDPIFAFATFDPAGSITLQGRTTDFIPDPKLPDGVKHDYAPKISDRRLTL